jgi:hypothetical protein
LLIATPDLDVGRDYAETLFGTRPVIGGSHPGQGSRNALLGLEDDTYIEIIAPDPAQPSDLPLARFLAALEAPAFAWWCARCDELEGLRDHLRAAGLDAGSIEPWSRQVPDAPPLCWRLLMPDERRLGAALPFFISWDDMDRHPARHLPLVGRLSKLSVEHPQAAMLGMLPPGVQTATAANGAVSATIQTESGPVRLAMPEVLFPAIAAARSNEN